MLLFQELLATITQFVLPYMLRYQKLQTSLQIPRRIITLEKETFRSAKNVQV